AKEEDTTTTAATTATEEGSSVVVTEFSLKPSEAGAGSQIEVAGMLTGKLAKVHLWLGDQRFGTPITVEENGSFRATRTIPDVAPGTYWLRLKTPNGQVLATHIFHVLAEGEDSSTTTPSEQSGDSDASDISTILWGAILVILLLIAIAVWWMWRRSSDHEKAVGKPPAERPPEDGDAD
ncbi:MAG: hypothetical protein O6951_04860, partial [Actinobacteria bacterium]|nr:hypothetical protein [Actinomycetota bacterium]